MGDKNQLSRVTTTDTIAKTGHGVLKAIYIDTPGDIIFRVYDGITAAGALLFEIDTDSATSGHLFTAPYINHPVNTGIFIDVVSGTTGSLVVIYE